jgi:hypothetical protein
MEIVNARFVRNPRPFDTEYPCNEIFGQFCMPINTSSRCAMAARELRLRWFFLGVFSGPLLFLRCDVLGGWLIAFETFLDAFVGNLPNFGRLGVIDLLGRKHSPGKTSGLGVDQFNAKNALVSAVRVHGDVLNAPVSGPVGSVDAPASPVTYPCFILGLNPVAHHQVGALCRLDLPKSLVCQFSDDRAVDLIVKLVRVQLQPLKLFLSAYICKGFVLCEVKVGIEIDGHLCGYWHRVQQGQ